MFKKLLLLLILFSVSVAVCMDRPEKRRAIQVTEAVGDQVTIQTADGQDFKVNIKFAQLSETLKNLIEDAGVDNSIPLPTVTGPIYAKILELLPDVQKILNPQESVQAKKDSQLEIIRKLTSLSGDDLIEVIKAANYLDIRILLDLAIDVAKKMSLNQLKSINLQSFFTLDKNIRNAIIFGNIIERVGPMPFRSLAILKGHQLRVVSVCVTPDGTKIVSGSGDGTIRIWDINTGKELAVLNGHTRDVISVCVTTDGSKIVSGSWDNTIRIWDINTLKELAVLRGHESGVNSVCVTPDGSKIVSGSGDIRIWDINTLKALAVLSGQESGVDSVCVTPDGSKIVSGSGDGTIRIWDINTLKELAVLKGHTGFVLSVCVTPDGSKIVSGSNDQKIRIWDINTLKELAVLRGHVGAVAAVCVTPDGSKIVSGGLDSIIRIWDLNSHKQLAVLRGHVASVNSVYVTPDGSKIVSGSFDRTIRIWDITIFNRLRDMNVEQAKQIWQYLQGDHAQGWRGVWRILVPPQPRQGVQGAAVVPAAMPVPALPPRGEGESATKRHKRGN